jgi:hypothetical protein
MLGVNHPGCLPRPLVPNTTTPITCLEERWVTGIEKAVSILVVPI